MPSQRDRDVWNAAIMSARSRCVERANDLASDRASTDRIREADDCADLVSGLLNPDEKTMRNAFAADGVRPDIDPISESLNMGDGVYRP